MQGTSAFANYALELVNLIAHYNLSFFVFQGKKLKGFHIQCCKPPQKFIRSKIIYGLPNVRLHKITKVNIKMIKDALPNKMTSFQTTTKDHSNYT